MLISQAALLRLGCASFLAGILLSFFYDILWALRMWSMPWDNRYTVPKIKHLRSSRNRKKTKNRTFLYQFTLFWGDMLFCLASATVMILLLYWLNSGKFRIVVPLSLALGFGACHVSLSKGARIALEWLSFGIETLLRLMLMPLKAVVNATMKAYSAIIQKQHLKRRIKQRRFYTRKELQQIDRAAQQLLPSYNSDNEKQRIKKGDTRAKRNTNQKTVQS